MHRGLLFLCAWLAAQGAGVTPAGNWPQWRGPDMTGATSAKNLPDKWSATENITWKLPLPEFSGSTPIVWNDRIFLNVGDGTELYLLWVVMKKGV